MNRLDNYCHIRNIDLINILKKKIKMTGGKMKKSYPYMDGTLRKDKSNFFLLLL